MPSIFKKIRDAKGTFHAKMGTVKDRNGMDLTEAEDIRKRWQEYTEEPYKKDLYDPDNHDGVITDLEPDILECTPDPPQACRAGCCGSRVPGPGSPVVPRAGPGAEGSGAGGVQTAKASRKQIGRAHV